MSGCAPCERRETPPADATASLFASRTVAEHVVRGVLGLVLAVAALGLAGRSAAALLLLVPAVLAWRGCPTCWALGLVETRRRRADAAPRR